MLSLMLAAAMKDNVAGLANNKQSMWIGVNLPQWFKINSIAKKQLLNLLVDHHSC